MRMRSSWGFQRITTQLSGRGAKVYQEDRNNEFALPEHSLLSQESWHWVSEDMLVYSCCYRSKNCFNSLNSHDFFLSLFICHEQQDESSSALDAQAEQDLLLSLRRLLESDDNNLSAVLFITHKNSVINACDRSITLSEGRITDG